MSDGRGSEIFQRYDVCFYDPVKRVLSRSLMDVQLSTNEGDMLLALIEGVEDKEGIIERVWGARGLVVSDSSYYKSLHTLRTHLSTIGFDRSALKTLPRRGAVLMCEIVPRSMAFSMDGERTQAEMITGDRGGNRVSVGRSLPAERCMERTEGSDVQVLAGPACAIKRLSVNCVLFLLITAGVSLPVLYAARSMTRPVALDGWKDISTAGQSALYVEASETVGVQAVGDYFPVESNLAGVNYFVRKPLSKLFVSCQKPESQGEAICMNYLDISKLD